ncbi:hypothetical protein R9C00_24155 [Flammeovirgaceae bacterium SG7u.111]|nr:hypothetical protein [Flammeovirgaceae bacterium SG7u.132]WPO34795.1 hypothetical protein R9C00_24155 [Flammeovirgaceae bacterium SG7u.111]
MLKKAGGGQFVVKPSPVELHGDSVAFVASATLPENVLKPKIMYEVEMFYATPDNEPLSLGKMEFDGDALAKNPAPSAEQYFGFIYDEKYKEGNVAFIGRAYKKTKPEKVKASELTPFPPVGDAAKGVITTSLLVQAPLLANYAPHGYDNSEEYIPTNVDFFFLQGRSDLRYSERRGERGKELDSYVQANKPVRTINVSGMHSPEGPTDVNSKLANERAAVVEDFYKKLAKKHDYEDAVDSINFQLKPVVEDWSTFKAALSAYDRLTDAQKSEVLDILNGPGDFVSKELKLQTLSFYKMIFRDVYPPLRAAKAEILEIKDKPTDAEIMVRAKKIANGDETEELNALQMSYAASMTPDLAEKEKIYQSAIKMSDSYAAYNNLGAVYMEMAANASSESKKTKLIKDAASNFKLSLQKQESTEAYANLASAQLLLDEKDEAFSTIGKVSGASSPELAASISALKGYVNITKASYASAISDLEKGGNSSETLYNKGLAILLKASKEMDADSYPKAMSAFEDAIAADSKNALAYYGAAITAARVGDAEKLTSNLAKAIEADGSLKEMAVKDLEFIKFQSAVAEATK